MGIKKDDYIEGYEYYGHTVKKVKGWVNSVNNDKENFFYNIQADDNWKGARGTTIESKLGRVSKLEFKQRI